MGKKVCSKCGREKELKDFYKDKGFKDGYKSNCKECSKKRYKGICELCNNEFYSEKKNQKYCSIKCLTDSQKKRVKFNCDYCGVEHEVAECFYEKSSNHYCSVKCKNRHHSELMSGKNNPRYNSINIKCDYCGKDIIRSKSNLDDNNFCCVECYYEYRKIHYTKEHHSSWEGGEVKVNCTCCGKSVFRKKSQVNTNNYCSVECMGNDRKRLYSGENNSNWQGGVTIISEYLRHSIKDWKLDTLKMYNFKCDISGNKNNLAIHHLYNFSDILLELFNEVNIEIKCTIAEYTEVELGLLKEKCNELHYKYGLGVCLTDELHNEFHSLYGKKNNTIEQYIEFKNKKILNQETA